MIHVHPFQKPLPYVPSNWNQNYKAPQGADTEVAEVCFVPLPLPSSTLGVVAARVKDTVFLGSGVLSRTWRDFNHTLQIPHNFYLTHWCQNPNEPPSWMQVGSFHFPKWVVAETPFIQVEVMGDACYRSVEADYYKYENHTGARQTSTRLEPILYRSRNHSIQLPFIPLHVSSDGDTQDVTLSYPFPEAGAGVSATLTSAQTVIMESKIPGLHHTWGETFLPGSFETLSSMALHAALGTQLDPSLDQWWDRFLSRVVNPDTKGLTATLAKKTVAPVLERLQVEAPLDYRFLQWLMNGSMVDKKCNNQLLGVFLQAVCPDYDRVLAALQTAREQVLQKDLVYAYRQKDTTILAKQAAILTLPGASTKVEEAEAKADWRKAKTNEAKADGLGITAALYPKLRSAIVKGSIPVTVFNQPSGQPINREFPLWEKSLARKGWAPILEEIAQDAARRGTYERDISSYLNFLFRIEVYLKKHTGRKWAAMPRYVQSQWDLEVDDSDNENGTSTKRSAFTPVADNDKGIITVPYVAVCVSGFRTQWCYARHYHLFTEGFLDPVSDGVVLQDLEVGLNGRDDYGLCFYTLTGTVTARGYPTFLIIFERLRSRNYTRVHFHRVRPQRSKDGQTTPACQLVEACYQYMAGNIPALDIAAQQGDLILIRPDQDPIAAGSKVEPEPTSGVTLTFESHVFKTLNPDGVLTLHRSAAKTPQNRLGFLDAPHGLQVLHPEHENLEALPPGWYEIRRCKSWEANPKSIWVRTID